MAFPHPPLATPTPPPIVYTNHQPHRNKPQPPPPPDHTYERVDKLIKQRRAVLRGYDQQGHEVVGPDLDLEERTELVGRQAWNTSYPSCDDVGNSILSCYPIQGLTLVESDWTKFIWNLRQPQFIGAVTVDVYLFHADSDLMALSFPGQQNAAGQIGVQVNDTWWGPRGDTFDGENVTFPYYFVVVPGGTVLTGGESRLATFLAIQTATPGTLASVSSASLASIAAQASESSASVLSVESVASVSLTSLALASASSASISSQSIESILSFSSALPTLSALSVASPAVFSSLSVESIASAASLASVSQSSVAFTRTSNGTVPTGDLQGGLGNGSGTPAWTIAVPTVLGFLALLFFCALLFLASRWFRWRRAELARRGSMGSQSPMMANMPGEPASKPPKPPSPALGGDAAGATLSRDGSSATTRPQVMTRSAEGNPDITLSGGPGDLSRSASGASPFSGVDAAIMARAFREALNKPDFSSPVEEGSSGPGSQENAQNGADSPGGSKDGHTTEEGFSRVGQIVQEEGGRVGRVGQQSVRVQGPGASNGQG
ncbi:hypothetical protein DACRYDRAFT_21547 [Dacryopinax primogenitus]|uniref:Uncharacterized protein n=1 Tax=Dacryopinax primogenitus (strain DJM 731) TaxID=1858805 RepID=M5GEK9_DACPD|nr:uncharacterized protein DACRYDRAFT_21547 [Dacryopinax primogenitus]EJU03353.1 hypothetical protein DACRYDRAFT_21547 [Dacryopinax primogenitus]